MNKDLLQLFWQDEHTRDAVKAFQIAMLEEDAIKRVFKEEDVSGLPEAKKLIEASFKRLDEVFKQKDKPVSSNNR